MAQAVLLHHTQAGGASHFDLLLDRGVRSAPNDRVLVSFRLGVRIDSMPAGSAVLAERLADHRRLYLEHEGPLPPVPNDGNVLEEHRARSRVDRAGNAIQSDAGGRGSHTPAAVSRGTVARVASGEGWIEHDENDEFVASVMWNGTPRMWIIGTRQPAGFCGVNGGETASRWMLDVSDRRWVRGTGKEPETRAGSSSSARPAFAIRIATEHDLPEIFEIYDPHVLHGTATFETVRKSEEQRLEWFRAHPSNRLPLIVAVEGTTRGGGGPGEGGGERVIGWAGLSLWSPREAYARTAESSVYVHPAHSTRGVGRALMNDLLNRAPACGIRVLIARPGEDNAASIALHERLGFVTVGVLRRVGEKFGRVLDVRILAKTLE